MLSKIVLAVVFAVVAYLVCVFAADLLISLNITITVVVGNFLKSFASLISVLVFLYYAFVGNSPLIPRP